MNCINCSAEIPTAFVAAIKNNRCPACDQACMSESDHTALFVLVSNLSGVSSGLSNDSVIRMAAALYEKFEIFPKGVVVDNILEKEVIYIRDTPVPQQAGYPYPPPQYNYGPISTGYPYAPPPPPPQAPPIPTHKPTAKPLATRMSEEEIKARYAENVKQAAKEEVEEYPADEYQDEIANEPEIAAASNQLLEEQAERKARLRLAQIRAEKGGIKK